MRIIALMSLCLLMGLTACARMQHEVEPIEIHVRHDVTIRHVDERLDEFFAFQENGTTRPATEPAATAPAAAEPPGTAPAPTRQPAE